MGALFAFTGLWDRWRDTGGTCLTTCSILTTTPNTVTLAVHDHMPEILDPDGYDLWLDPGMRNLDTVGEVMKPYDTRQMHSHPVSINHAIHSFYTHLRSRPVLPD